MEKKKKKQESKEQEQTYVLSCSLESTDQMMEGEENQGLQGQQCASFVWLLSPC